MLNKILHHVEFFGRNSNIIELCFTM